MTAPDSPTGGPSARALRVHELERRLFGRPGAEGAASAASPADRESDLAELQRLRASAGAAEDHDGTDAAADANADEPAQADRAEPPRHPPIEAGPDRDAPEQPVRRAPARALLGAALLAIAAGGLAGAVLAPPSPPALEALDAPVSPLDRARSDTLRDAGMPLLDDARILTESETATLVGFRAPQGTAEEIRADEATLTGTELSPFGGAIYLLPEPTALDRADIRQAEVCAWVVERNFAIEGRCAPLADFAESGLVFETERFGLRYAVDWAPTGEAELRTLPVEPAEP